jgi:hypothetical protein
MTSPSWPLRGQTILLVGGPVSADELEEIDRPGNAQDDEVDLRVEEAVVTLARGVFGRGGRILAREHPLLTPLLLEATFEYWEALPGEGSSDAREQRRFIDAPLLVYKSPRTPDHDDVGGDVDRAARIGCLRYVDDEQLDDLPIALVVCIGGVGELVDELEPFSRVWRGVHHRRKPPAYVIPSTGGAASRTVRDARQDFIVFDLEESVVRTVRALREKVKFVPPEELRAMDADRPQSRGRFEDEPPLEPEPIPPDLQYAFYPLLIATILDETR